MIVLISLILSLLGLLVTDANTADADAGIRGQYLEARTCDVYTGPCFANAEVGAVGHEATLAWKIEAGRVGGVDLAGLCVVAVVEASNTLGEQESHRKTPRKTAAQVLSPRMQRLSASQTATQSCRFDNPAPGLSAG